MVRFPTGLCHHVYDVTADDGQRLVVRIARPGNERLLRGAVFWQEQLRPIGIPLATIREANFDLTDVAFAYLVLERLDGTDLGEAYPALSRESKRSLGAQAARLQQTVATLPAAHGYGDALSYESTDLAPGWSDVVARNLALCRMRADERAPISTREVAALENASSALQPSLARVAPTAFLDDITTKNVIVTERGRLSGIVDVDTLCFGDPLYTLALTQAACTRLGLDEEYTAVWRRALELTEDEAARLGFYTRLFAAVLLSEHGQRFNRDTRVHFESDEICRLRRLLATEPGEARHQTG